MHRPFECDETPRRYPAAMARKVHRAKSFSYDLLADWRPYAVPPDQVRNVHGWIYQGTVTLEGVTGALAHRQGWFGICGREL